MCLPRQVLILGYDVKMEGAGIGITVIRTTFECMSRSDVLRAPPKKTFST